MPTLAQPLMRRQPAHEANEWALCRYLTCSVLPVRMACNLDCPFCFSKSSVSAFRAERAVWQHMDVEAYYEFARQRGATRLVITGGGEPLLRADDVVSLIERGRSYFDEIACFTNGSLLTRELTQRLKDAGLSYLCYSRHHEDDQRCRDLMGAGAPSLNQFFSMADGLHVRATCVMARGWVDSRAGIENYMQVLGQYGVTEFTFKHTYVAYEQSVFGQSEANVWSRQHQVEWDPFADDGGEIARLPWGPVIRRLDGRQVCYYFEPDPVWELENRLCRSLNLLSDGTVYGSLEDQRSHLFQLSRS